VAFKKVVAVVDQDELLWIGGRFHHRFEFVAGAELVKRSADEKFGLEAVTQKIK
jgi:hypothetical protein